ncbi:porin [Derxia gummosa]|uniref:Porin n=1 Tax=Derxia gummosa DSM 723 TaxID=1121388 RepID=A0A9U5G6J4_9BURK|nr:porin [Derxia gummosa]
MTLMKNALVGAGAALCLVIANQANAQSTVTVYGYIDLGMVKTNSGGWKVDRGYNNWLGFKGSEDLGDGLSTIFNLQTRFNPDTGTSERSTTLWQGETTVGFKSTKAGTLRLGRALTPLWQQIWKFEPWWNSGFNGSMAAFQTGSYTSDGVQDVALGYANFSRFSNAVYYDSPTVGGFSGHVAGEAERRDGSKERGASGTLQYGIGGFASMLSWERNSAGDNIRVGAASYDFGATKLMGSYADVNLQAVGKERAWVLAATQSLGGANTLRAGFGRNNRTDDHKASLGVMHDLSKRTTIYSDVWRTYTTGADTITGFALGITHSF